jgi:tetratricopeptide (TPR) repeat protein
MNQQSTTHHGRTGLAASDSTAGFVGRESLSSRVRAAGQVLPHLWRAADATGMPAPQFTRLFASAKARYSALLGLLLFPLAVTAAPAPLEWAFRFASALTSDPVDQAKAQEKVVRDYLALGALTEATECAAQMRGWRRGTAWAEIAVVAAHRGQSTTAVAAIREAELVQHAFRSDWQSLRIRAHLARAHAALGQLERTRKLTAELPAEEFAKGAAATAQAQAVAGHIAAALAELKVYEGTDDFDRNFQLLDGYLDLARHPALTNQPAQRELALDGAARVLQLMPPLRQGEVIPGLSRDYIRVGAAGKARPLLEEIEPVVQSWTQEPRFQAPILAQLALAWRDLGEHDRAARLLRQAEELATTGDPMDHPLNCAAVAGAFAEAGDRAKAAEIYERGLTIAAGFVNARPRALSISEICRSMGRQRWELDATWQARLTELAAGLKDPW